MPMTSTTAGTKAAAPAPVSLKTYTLRTPVSSNVTAIQYLGKPDSHNTFAGHPTREDPLHHQTLVLVQTAQGGQPAFAGDWIVQDSKGNSSVMKDAEFYAKYAVDAPVAASKPLLAPAKAVAPVAAAKPVVAAPVAAKPAASAPVATKPATPPAKQPTPHILT